MKLWIGSSPGSRHVSLPTGQPFVGTDIAGVSAT